MKYCFKILPHLSILKAWVKLFLVEIDMLAILLDKVATF